MRRGPGSGVSWARQALMEWINTELLPEHIMVRSLEEDMFDGLILHHLFRKCFQSRSPGGRGWVGGDSWGPGAWGSAYGL